MDDLFKKFINTGVGFLSQGNKRVQTALDKLVKESKISEQEGKKIMDDLLKSGEAKRKDLEKQLQALADNLKDRVGLNGEAEQPAPKAKAAPKKAAASAPAKAATAKKAPAPKAAKVKKAAPSSEQE
jgi:polyhydroxyalkanoate synthesis regulator phasin